MKNLRGRRDVEAHGRQSERRGEVRESRIDADERLGLHERGRHAVEPRARRDDGIGNEAGQPLDAFPLLVVAPEKDAAASLIEKRTAEIDPMVFGPELFVAARVDGERHPGTFGDLERLRPGRKPETAALAAAVHARYKISFGKDTRFPIAERNGDRNGFT